MPARRPNHHQTTRLRFVGAMPHNEGMLILARIEALHGPAGWIGVGSILKMHLVDDQLADGDFSRAVQRATDRIAREHLAEAMSQEQALPGL